jgi:hypothetical protein
MPPGQRKARTVSPAPGSAHGAPGIEHDPALTSGRGWVRGFSRSRLPPGVENSRHVIAHAVARLRAVDARHQELVVCGVLVAHGGRDSELDRVVVEGACGGGAPDAPPAACRRVARDRPCTLGRASGERRGDLVGETRLQLQILPGAPLLVALATPLACFGVRQAFALGGRERILSTRIPWRS